MTTLRFTNLPNTRGRMAKRFTLADDGTIQKGSAGQMTAGKVETVSVALAELPAFLAGLRSNEAIALGICDAAPAPIYTKDEQPKHPGSVARTLDFFHMPAGSALGFIDCDTISDPDKLTAAIVEAFPEFDDAAKIFFPSSSAGIYRAGEDKPVADSHGLHIYFTVRNGADFSRFGEALCKRLWLAGHGHVEVGAAGQMLARQIIDAATFSPERIIFEAAPIIGPGLERRPPTPTQLDGGILDTSLCPDLSPEEEAEYQRLVAEAKAAKETEAEEVHAAWIHARGKEIANAQNIPYAQAVAVAAKAAEGMDLEADFILQFQKFGAVAVADVLKDAETLEKYDGEALHDPIEPDYKSKFCAILYANGGMDPVVYSQAHGGQKFKLPSLQIYRDKRAAAEAADAADLEVDPEPPATPKPWEGIADEQILAAIDGTLLEPMVRTLQSVTIPPLPIQITLPKAIALAGTALSQPVEFDPKTETRRGLDLARNIILTAGGQLCNVMACIVGPSGCGKDVGNLPARIAQEHGVAIGHAGSAEGLADAYVANGAGLMVISELQPYLDRHAWQHKATGFLTMAFNQNQAKVVLSSRNGEPRDVRYCAPNVIANIQPNVLADIGDTLLLDSGFLPRFIFSYLPEIRSWRPATEHIALDPLSAAFRAYRRIQARVRIPTGYLQEVMDEFLAHDAQLPGHYNRLVNEYGPRLAVMLAADPNRPGEVFITPDHWQRTATLIRWFYSSAAQVLATIGEEKHVRKMEGRLDRMFAWIRKHPAGVSKQIFSRVFHRGTTSEDRDRDLRELEARGCISIRTTGAKTMLRAVR